MEDNNSVKTVFYTPMVEMFVRESPEGMPFLVETWEEATDYSGKLIWFQKLILENKMNIDDLTEKHYLQITNMNIDVDPVIQPKYNWFIRWLIKFVNQLNN